VYSCSGSERKELLASLGRREVAQALDDPALVVPLAKFRQRAAQLLDVLEHPDPQQLLLQRANETFDATVAFRLAHQRGRRRHAQESDFGLIIVAHVLAAVIVPVADARRRAGAKAAPGFFDQQLLGFLKQRGLSYILVARWTPWLKREAARVTDWRALDEHYAAGQFSLQLLGWDRPRRFVVIREQRRAQRASLGRKLLEVPGYAFRVFVTNLALPPEELWRDYNRGADMENRIAELKHDSGADDFCLQEFFATEAAFRSI